MESFMKERKGTKIIFKIIFTHLEYGITWSPKIHISNKDVSKMEWTELSLAPIPEQLLVYARVDWLYHQVFRLRNLWLPGAQP